MTRPFRPGGHELIKGLTRKTRGWCQGGYGRRIALLDKALRRVNLIGIPQRKMCERKGKNYFSVVLQDHFVLLFTPLILALSVGLTLNV